LLPFPTRFLLVQLTLVSILVFTVAAAGCSGGRGLRTSAAGGTPGSAAGTTGTTGGNTDTTGGSGGGATTVTTGGTTGGPSTALHPQDGGVDAVPPADASRDTSVRIPLLHRPAGSTCPSERAPGALDCRCPGSDGGCSCVQGNCSQDSDCTAGVNGRCLLANAPFLYVGCTYDTCFSDSDCSPQEPCACRASASSTIENYCLVGSNCRVDTDCGPGGYCSPSQVSGGCDCLSTALCGPDVHCWAGDTPVPCVCGDSCGHGYFCHTPQDTCLDDSDCTNWGTCNYDWLNTTWSCSYCLPWT
jgi:hypothetical protein